MNDRAVLETKSGPIHIEVDSEGAVIRCGFSSKVEVSNPGSGNVQPALNQLREYFAGERRSFDIPVHMEGTEFQKRVWVALLAIPFGQTISYSELARRVGSPKAVRAVGRANGANPIAVIVPCHRVIGSNGSLTGYAGGMERKRELLMLEGVNCDQNSRFDFK